MRQEQQQQLLRQMNPQMMPAQYHSMMRGMQANGMNLGNAGELRHKAMQNSGRQAYAP